MEIKSMAKIKYSYDLDGINLQELSESNVVKTEVRKFNLLLKKLTNQEYFKLGDIITCTLIVSNLGNYKNTNVVIKDNLLNQELIDYSIKATTLENNLVKPNYSLDNNQLKIEIEKIDPHEVIIITYKVKPLKQTQIESVTTIQSDETTLAEVNNNPLKHGYARIECVKAVSDDVTFINTDLTYILSLVNKGNIAAYNVEVYDELPITFELDSYNPVTLNNNLINYQLEGNILKLLIPSIEPNAILDIKVNGRIIK